jgi:hypothetical protein
VFVAVGDGVFVTVIVFVAAGGSVLVGVAAQPNAAALSAHTSSVLNRPTLAAQVARWRCIQKPSDAVIPLTWR